jgi:hypothetical protein
MMLGGLWQATSQIMCQGKAMNMQQLADCVCHCGVVSHATQSVELPSLPARLAKQRQWQDTPQGQTRSRRVGDASKKTLPGSVDALQSIGGGVAAQGFRPQLKRA